MGSYEGVSLPNSGSEGGNNYSAGASGSGGGENYAANYSSGEASSFNWNQSNDYDWNSPGDVGWGNPASSLNDFSPSNSNNDDWYGLKSGVGWGEENDRLDVAKIETTLGATEHYDVAGTNGPTGYAGNSLVEGIKEFQKQNGLDNDGVIKRDGPTLKALKGKTGHIFGEYPSPSLEEIDKHHESVAKDEKPLLQHRPPVPKIQPLPDLPVIDDEDQGAIGRSIKYLTGYSDPGGHPEDTARIIKDVGDYGIAYARELVSQLQEADSGLGDKYLTSLAGLLSSDLQEKFLGGPMPENIPIGVSLAAVAALAGSRSNKLGNNRNEEDGAPEKEAEYGGDDDEDYSGDWGDDGGDGDYGEQNFDSQVAEGERTENLAAWLDEQTLNNLAELGRRQVSGEFEQSSSNDPREAFDRTLFPGHGENSLRDEFDRSLFNQSVEEQREEREKPDFRDVRKTLTLKDGKLIGDASPPREILKLSKENQETRDALEKIGNRSELRGYSASSTLLRHYLNGNGEKVEITDLEKLRSYGPVQEGEKNVGRHVESAFTGKWKGENTYLEDLHKGVTDFIASGEKEMQLKRNLDGGFSGEGFQTLTDMGGAIGSGTIQGQTDITLRREGNVIKVQGEVEYRLHDTYDFAKGKGGEDGWLPHGLVGGKWDLHRSDIIRLEEAQGVTPFEVTSTPWRKEVHGTLYLDDGGKIINNGEQRPIFSWKDIK